MMIPKTRFIMMLSIAVIADLFQLILAGIDFTFIGFPLGVGLNLVLDGLVLGVLSMMHPTKVWAIALVEAIPVVDILPLWTGAVIYVYNQEATKSIPIS